MGINEKIQQKGFESEVQKAIVNIHFTQSYFSGLVHNALKPYKISSQQFNVLRILKGKDPEPISINEISERMIDRMSNASRLVDKLCLKGLAIRSQSESDKRQVNVGITVFGKEVLKGLNTSIDEVIKSHNTFLSLEEFQKLNQLLDKVRNDESDK